MKYTTGKAGRIIIARFEDREDILLNLQEIVKKEDIKAGVFYLIGGLRKGRIVVGPKRDELPPESIWKEISDSHEVIAIGTIFWQGDVPKIHLHGVFGKGEAVSGGCLRETVSVGCLREKGEVFLIIEAILIEIEGVNVERMPDPTTGLSLLRIV